MKRAAMECELEQQLDQLESEEQQLLCQVHFLQNYKFHLERQHHIIAMHERLIREMKVSPIEHEEIKREPRCPSPQWLALFHI